MAARLVAVAVLLAIGGAMQIAAAPGASAHNQLLSSEPAADAVLAQAPARIALSFAEPVNAALSQLALTVGDGDPISLTPVASGSRLAADVPASAAAPAAGADPASGPGAPQRWIVGYRTVSADGHPIRGSLSFVVGEGPSTSPASPAGPASAGETSPPGAGADTTDSVAAGEDAAGPAGKGVDAAADLAGGRGWAMLGTAGALGALGATALGYWLLRRRGHATGR